MIEDDRLRDRRVLIVEDEMMVAMLVEDMLGDVGCQIVGPASRVDEALKLLSENAVDLALLDVNLHGQETYPIADALALKGIPFVFATGYGARGLQEAYRHLPALQKPFHQADLLRALADICPPRAA